MSQKTIFLIGFMGVGKTTLGKKLAKALGVDFIDTDDELEKQLGCSISTYFSKYGEEDFRIKEREWIANYVSKPQVVATGGGMPCFFDNMEQLNQKGITIYLERPAKELFQRLINAKQQRPLVKVLEADELLQFIQTKLDERAPFYKQAKYVLGREDQTIDKILLTLDA